jgi:hypothetical protein
MMLDVVPKVCASTLNRPSLTLGSQNTGIKDGVQMNVFLL